LLKDPLIRNRNQSNKWLESDGSKDVHPIETEKIPQSRTN